MVKRTRSNVLPGQAGPAGASASSSTGVPTWKYVIILVLGVLVGRATKHLAATVGADPAAHLTGAAAGAGVRSDAALRRQQQTWLMTQQHARASQKDTTRAVDRATKALREENARLQKEAALLRREHNAQAKELREDAAQLTSVSQALAQASAVAAEASAEKEAAEQALEEAGAEKAELQAELRQAEDVALSAATDAAQLEEKIDAKAAEQRYASSLAAARPTDTAVCDKKLSEVDCGFPGITPGQCAARDGCCWDDTSPNKWCYRASAGPAVNVTAAGYPRDRTAYLVTPDELSAATTKSIALLKGLGFRVRLVKGPGAAQYGNNPVVANKFAHMAAYELIAKGKAPWGYVFETDIALAGPVKLPDLKAGEGLDTRFVYLGVCLVNAYLTPKQLSSKRACGGTNCLQAYAISKAGAAEVLKLARYHTKAHAMGWVVSLWCRKQRGGFPVLGYQFVSPQFAGHRGFFFHEVGDGRSWQAGR